MILGYNTNGLNNHSMLAGLELLDRIGYRSVAITVDHGWLSPHDANCQQLKTVKEFLQAKHFTNVIETGARFLLDPNQKHFPTLLSNGAGESIRRIDFLKYCIDVAAELESDCVSLWSGIKPPADTAQVSFERLVENLRIVLEYAETKDVDIGFEPEPGMLIETTTDFARLLERCDSPRLKLTLDVGHLLCSGEVPIEKYIQKWAEKLVNIHIEDMKPGVHEHLMFGEGEMPFPAIIDSLATVGYQGGVHVELSRHSHNAAVIAQESYDFLQALWPHFGRKEFGERHL